MIAAHESSIRFELVLGVSDFETVNVMVHSGI